MEMVKWWTEHLWSWINNNNSNNHDERNRSGSLLYSVPHRRCTDSTQMELAYLSNWPTAHLYLQVNWLPSKMKIWNYFSRCMVLTVVPYRVEFVLAPAVDHDANNRPFVLCTCKRADIFDRCCCYCRCHCCLRPNWLCRQNSFREWKCQRHWHCCTVQRCHGSPTVRSRTKRLPIDESAAVFLLLSTCFFAVTLFVQSVLCSIVNGVSLLFYECERKWHMKNRISAFNGRLCRRYKLSLLQFTFTIIIIIIIVPRRVSMRAGCNLTRDAPKPPRKSFLF